MSLLQKKNKLRSYISTLENTTCPLLYRESKPGKKFLFSVPFVPLHCNGFYYDMYKIP
jgi:hypothetical protein